MICETCHGTGKMALHRVAMCPNCEGSGIDYCCGPSAVPDMAASRSPEIVKELAKYISAEDISMGTGLTVDEIAAIVGDA